MNRDKTKEKEIIDIFHKCPDGYSTIFKKSRKDLGNYLFELYPQLQDKYYKTSTRVYWLINNLTDFPKCKTCGKTIIRNVARVNNPQLEYCTVLCQNLDKKIIYTKFDTMYKKLIGRVDVNDPEKVIRFLYNNYRTNTMFILLKSPQLHHVKDWLYCRYDKLQSNKYTDITRIYWFLNNIEDFPRCKQCGRMIYRNVLNLNIGYSKNGYAFCSKKCSNKNSNTQNKRRKTCLKKYGYDNYSKTPEFHKKSIQTYTYNKTVFASAQEIAYYIYLTDNNIDFEYQPSSCCFKYTLDIDGSEHTYHPDFLLKSDNFIVEIKGKNNFNKNGYPIRNNMDDWHEKYQCMKDNNVHMILDNDPFMLSLMHMCAKKFGKVTWYKDFRNRK